MKSPRSRDTQMRHQCRGTVVLPRQVPPVGPLPHQVVYLSVTEGRERVIARGFAAGFVVQRASGEPESPQVIGYSPRVQLMAAVSIAFP